MFAEWERYARVFTGLGITGKNGSRAAIGGTISAEPLFAFYGLNMTGAEVSMFSYPDFLPGGQWKTMLEKEKITIEGKEQTIKHYTPVADYIKKHQAPQP
jgi:hypothetical protein